MNTVMIQTFKNLVKLGQFRCQSRNKKPRNQKGLQKSMMNNTPTKNLKRVLDKRSHLIGCHKTRRSLETIVKDQMVKDLAREEAQKKKSMRKRL